MWAPLSVIKTIIWIEKCLEDIPGWIFIHSLHLLLDFVIAARLATRLLRHLRLISCRAGVLRDSRRSFFIPSRLPILITLNLVRSLNDFVSISFLTRRHDMRWDRLLWRMLGTLRLLSRLRTLPVFTFVGGSLNLLFVGQSAQADHLLEGLFITRHS